jgi:hypothetical protein
MKEELYDINWLFFGGKPQTPHGRLRRVLGSLRSSAKQSYAFLLLFLEKEDSSQTPMVGFAEIWVA